MGNNFISFKPLAAWRLSPAAALAPGRADQRQNINFDYACSVLLLLMAPLYFMCYTFRSFV